MGFKKILKTTSINLTGSKSAKNLPRLCNEVLRMKKMEH